MPNPVPRRYIVQLAPTFTAKEAGELAAWAEQLGWSVSGVTREAAVLGLQTLRKRWERETGGPLNPRKLAEHIEAAAERGEKQAARRTRTDRTRRGSVDTATGA